MTTIKTIIHEGRLRLDEPLDLPEGSQVEVFIRVLPDQTPQVGLSLDDIEGDSPEAIARWISYFESLTPPTMSEAEWAAWEQRRREDREWELKHLPEREEQLQRLFE